VFVSGKLFQHCPMFVGLRYVNDIGTSGLYYKILQSFFTDFCNKLEYLSLVSLSSLV
jgi:hypothetical protein